MRSAALARKVQDTLQDWCDEHLIDVDGMPLRPLVKLSTTAAEVTLTLEIPIWSSAIAPDGALPAKLSIKHAKQFLRRVAEANE